MDRKCPSIKNVRKITHIKDPRSSHLIKPAFCVRTGLSADIAVIPTASCPTFGSRACTGDAAPIYTTQFIWLRFSTFVLVHDIKNSEKKRETFQHFQVWRKRTSGICTRRTGRLYKARPRLYRIQIFQINTRWKALAEIYTMHSFAPFSNLKILVRYC